MITTVVNVRLHKFDTYMGRAGRGRDGYFGNPRVRVGRPGSTLGAFRSYFFGRMMDDSEFRRRVFALRGSRLGCFCVREPWVVGDPGDPDDFICHAQVIAHFIETNEE